MDNAQAPRSPAVLLLSVMCLAGICALPPAVYFTLSAISAYASGAEVPGPILAIGVPTLNLSQ